MRSGYSLSLVRIDSSNASVLFRKLFHSAAKHRNETRRELSVTVEIGIKAGCLLERLDKSDVSENRRIIIREHAKRKKTSNLF